MEVKGGGFTLNSVNEALSNVISKANRYARLK